MEVSKFVFACILTHFFWPSTSGVTNKPAVQGSLLGVTVKPATLLHRRSTRAHTNGGNPSTGIWIPVNPKYRRSKEQRPFYDQRSLTYPPSHSHYGQSRPNPLSFHSPKRLQMTRPSQPEPQPSSSRQLYQYPPVRGTNPPASSYLPSQASTGSPSPAEVLMNNPSESELRFLFHRPEDENLIKSTILNESGRYNERVSFVRGPTLKFQRRQTIYLPPKKKSVIYIMLKEPQVTTDLEVIESQSDPTPEVNIIYEKAGGVRTKHYYSTSDKRHQGSTGSQTFPTNALQHKFGEPDSSSSASEVKPIKIPVVTVENSEGIGVMTSRKSRESSSSSPKPIPEAKIPSNPCQPNSGKKLRKR